MTIETAIAKNNSALVRRVYLPAVAGIRTDRLKKAMAEAGFDQGDLAAKIGVSQGAVSQIVLGNTVRSRYLPDIADALGVSLQWLKGESDNPDPTAPPVPTLEQVADHFNLGLVPEIDLGLGLSGGGEDGSYYATNYTPTNFVPFPLNWLRSIMRGSIEQLFVARGEGDSMLPTILDGDFVLIDRAQQVVNRQDRLWAVNYGGLGMVKRLRRQPDGKIIIMSDNPSVAPYPPANDDEVVVLGRVIWIGRKM